MDGERIHLLTPQRDLRASAGQVLRGEGTRLTGHTQQLFRESQDLLDCSRELHDGSDEFGTLSLIHGR